jgi:hypothetical protein
VMNNKKAFGIADVAPEPAERFDTVLIVPGTSFDQISHSCLRSGLIAQRSAAR